MRHVCEKTSCSFLAYSDFTCLFKLFSKRMSSIGAESPTPRLCHHEVIIDVTHPCCPYIQLRQLFVSPADRTYIHLARHVPGFKPSFSLNTDVDRNEEAASFFSVTTDGVYIHPSHTAQFYPLPDTISRKMPKIVSESKIRIPDPPWI